jgi:HEAT repeat protein
MTSPRLAALMAAFRTAPTINGESVRKIETLHELGGLADPEIGPFLATIIGDAREYDLARIEALRMLETGQFGDDQDRDKLARRILRVLLDDEDDQVRAYAARALSNFTDVSDVVAALGKHVLDGDEDDDVRHNAFFALERSAASEEAIDLVTRALAVEGAARVLARWHGLSK